MAVQGSSSDMWNSLAEFTKSAQDNGGDAVTWVVQLSSALKSAGILLPSPELAHLLVSHICWDNNVPTAWKFLDKAITLKAAPPLLVLAHLSTRVLPFRQIYPTAYRLFLELVKRYTLHVQSEVSAPNYHQIMKCVDDVLCLSQKFGLETFEPLTIGVLFVFSMVWQLLDACLDDEKLLTYSKGVKLMWLPVSQSLQTKAPNSIADNRIDAQERIVMSNTIVAIEVVGDLLENEVTSRILSLLCYSMPLYWREFRQRLRILIAKASILGKMRSTAQQVIFELASGKRTALHICRTLQVLHQTTISPGFTMSVNHFNAPSNSVIWLPIDFFLQSLLDGSQMSSGSAVDVLTGLVRSLQAINNASWHDAFLGLWVAALRLVQRERDAREEPLSIPDMCLCMLLCITTLAIAKIVREEDRNSIEEFSACSVTDVGEIKGKCQKEFVSSLQQLGDYKGLLVPPLPVTPLANQAATKAMLFVSGFPTESVQLESMNINNMPVNCSGNLWHLIVESCIARELLDSSAYVWPGYVNEHISHISHGISCPVVGWSSLMMGSPLTLSLANTLVATPASCLAEIEKVYGIALNGSDEERIYAAMVISGASLVCGWNIQEHTALLIVKILSPPIIDDLTSTYNHLIHFGPVFHILLGGISTRTCLLVFSFNGLVPQLAGALMPICEVFGSCNPKLSWTLPSGEEITALSVFSHAFAVLLRLWKFDHPRYGHILVDKAPLVTGYSPEFLLLVRNRQLASSEYAIDENRSKTGEKLNTLSSKPVYMHLFPKLSRWYQQHQACISSTLSGLSRSDPVHQIVNELLIMMFKKGDKDFTSLTSTSSGNCVSTSLAESVCLNLTAWDILEGMPFALDTAFTACAHGKLSPREFSTGLKDLADFFPASVATIVSYFSAELARGVWKPASMNGTDWPSPAANISSVEQQIKKILIATGVDVPSLVTGGSFPAMLPLPLAAFLSFTITYRIDKATKPFLTLAGIALSNLAACCPWPSMPIMTALWTQKAKRWSHFLVSMAACTVFHHNNDAVVQLLKTCFLSILGFRSADEFGAGAVGSLFGHASSLDLCSPVAPGVLYLRIHRYVRDFSFAVEEILSLLTFSVREIASSGLAMTQSEAVRRMKSGMKHGHFSVPVAMARVRAASSFGASVVWMSGGLSLINDLMQETLPSWFISGNAASMGGGCVGVTAMLLGYALAYFALFCGAFAWGIDSTPESKGRSGTLTTHFIFLANGLDRRASACCGGCCWRAYVLSFISLIIKCTPLWIPEIELELVKRVSKGLRQWGEHELALSLLGLAGVKAMGSAAEIVFT